MIYFAYGSNMFTYRLEKRVGKVRILGVAKLHSYKLKLHKISTDKSSKANALPVDNPEEFVWGVVFEIDPANKGRLDKEEGLGKGYREDRVSVELLATGEFIKAFTYIADKIDNSGKLLPYDWYMRLILEGVQEHQFPPDYIKYIESFQTKEDDNTGRRDTNLFVIRESKFTRKSIAPFFEAMAEMDKAKECKIDIPDHVLDGRKIMIEKKGKSFHFETSSKILKGIQTHKELSVRGKEIIVTTRDDQKWLVNDKHFLLNNISYDFDNELKILDGEITAISSAALDDKTEGIYRLIIPSEKGLELNRDYERHPFVSNFQFFSDFIPLSIRQREYHFFQIKRGDTHYIFIDCLGAITFRDFQVSANCILMTYAFLSGYYPAGQGYFFSCTDPTIEKPLNIFFHSLGDTISNNYGVFTTNPYIGIDMDSIRKDEQGLIHEEERQRLYKDMLPFSSVVFSNICEFAFENDYILRSMVLLIQNQVATLEMKIPVQYVTIETIASAFGENNKKLKPIEDDKLARKLSKELKKVVDDFLKENGAIPKERLLPVYKKIETINAPPNADKLKKAFELVGHTISATENQILKDRNKYLHGSINTFGSLDEDFKELFFLSLKLHFMIAVLILKKAGFSGRIINYPKRYEYITGKFLEEEILIKI